MKEKTVKLGFTKIATSLKKMLLRDWKDKPKTGGKKALTNMCQI